MIKFDYTELRTARRRNRLTQSDVAKKIGVTAAALSHYENDTSSIPCNKLEMLINYLHIDINKLFVFTEENKDDDDAFDRLKAENDKLKFILSNLKTIIGFE